MQQPIVLFNKDNCSVEVVTIFKLKGDWDAEKVIDIPNKKVTFKFQFYLLNQRIRVFFTGGGVDHA